MTNTIPSRRMFVAASTLARKVPYIAKLLTLASPESVECEVVHVTRA